MKFETDYIEKLAKVLADTGLTEISLEDGEQAITLRKDVVVAPVAPVASAPVQAAPAAQAQAPSAPAPQGRRRRQTPGIPPPPRPGQWDPVRRWPHPESAWAVCSS